MTTDADFIIHKIHFYILIFGTISVLIGGLFNNIFLAINGGALCCTTFVK